MMDFVKRHLFLLGLGAGVFVLGVLILLFVQFGYRSPNAAMEDQLDGAVRRGRSLGGGTLYDEAVVEALKAAVQERRTRYEETLAYIAKRGRERKVLVANLFPTTTDTTLLHTCKTEYKVALERCMARLGAVDPTLPADAPEAVKMAKLDEINKAVMLVNPGYAFHRPDWVDKPEAPNLDLVRYGQENVWLMEDLVESVAKTNEAYIGQKPRTIANAVIKELLEIRIGNDQVILEGGRGGGGSGRYRGAVAAEGVREASLTGRPSRPGFCLVLPWRMVVVADARVFGDLVRRLKDRETFLTVDGALVEPITEKSFAQGSKQFNVSDLKQYGGAPVVRLTLTGESLVFQLPEGRVTTPPEVLQAAAQKKAQAEAKKAEEAKKPEAGSTKAGAAKKTR